MKKVVVIIISFLCLISPIKAEIDKGTIDILKKFITLYNGEKDEMYDYVHKENQEINNYIDITKGQVNIVIGKTIDIVDSSDDQITLGAVINADGRTHNTYWSVKNQYTYFIFIKEDGKFVLYDTDFFRNANIDQLNKDFNSLVLRMLLISVFAFITIMTIIIVIVNVIVAKQESNYYSKKRKK